MTAWNIITGCCIAVVAAGNNVLGWQISHGTRWFFWIMALVFWPGSIAAVLTGWVPGPFVAFTAVIIVNLTIELSKTQRRWARAEREADGSRGLWLNLGGVELRKQEPPQDH